MSERIEKFSTVVRQDGVIYEVEAVGATTAQGLWEGWLEFSPADATLPVLRTERETTQPNKQALQYWASGLEPVYFEGALGRAQPKT